VNKRRRLGLIVVLGVAITAAAFFALRPREPVYEGKKLGEWLKIFANETGGSREQAAKAIAYWMEAAPLQILARCLRPGIVELLESARNKGIRMGLLSDYPARRKLLAMGLDSYFSVVLSAQDCRIGEFKPGVGHLAKETGTPVVPMHIQGAFQIMPRHQKIPLPGPVRVRIGRPMTPQRAEGSREFTARVEKAVRTLAAGPRQPELQGSWIERWEASKPRELRYETD